MTSLILIALAPPLADRVRRAFPGQCADLGAVVTDEDSDVGFLCADPVFLSNDPERATRADHLITQGVPLVCYTSFTPNGLQAAAREPRPVARHLLFDVDDGPERLIQLRDEVAAQRFQLELFRLIGYHLRGLPYGLREAAESLLHNPAGYFDAGDLSRSAGYSRRHADRRFAASGLAPVKHLVIAARAYLCIRRLAVTALSINDCAAAMGYESDRALRRHTQAIWGITPKECTGIPRSVLLEGVRRFVLVPSENDGLETLTIQCPIRASRDVRTTTL